MQNEQATLGGGCFWCLEAIFERQSGVKSVTSGYAGGAEPNPSYEAVCTGNTGHAEVIQVEYDPETISYAELLDLFWGCHDPTTLNRQGGDVGTQYRSVILYHDAEQQAEAMRSKAAVASDFADRLVTEISPLSKFYPAETYHQGYYQRNREASYCQIVIRPKLRKLEIE
ncbi:MAG: peptide-methionine (S)-S-oxide reductase MsrA [SAR324 cluster bacterium]|jgi:peptide-methionine (S)-S-oxide reductase|nr:peptide-methionine (S)-S-oxide reductase MsrA [SAR324 cluster bacterium]MEC7418006.1 peptide-methionine (S)-S-oxide reductase MsrA [SAR324 cluster bacterium]HIL15768.1 peptide-methionine (S)-S-oxide reductase [Deltaproteobacteria bacterium]|tara:strand:+ start:949 stop:1458 length:510 start_codon:yes stop_codon:yes gene_type:complete